MWFHFLYEELKHKLLKIEYTSIQHVWADILTKSIPKVKHHAYLQGPHSQLFSNLKQGGVT